jgi:cytochrome c2
MRNSLCLLALLACAALLDGCSSTARGGIIVVDGDSRRGAASISRHGCGSCHTIAGIAGAHGLVGPPLTGLRNRMYVAGMLPNSPGNLMHWIRNPKQVNPKTAMPDLGVSAGDAADIAAYIYSIP